MSYIPPILDQDAEALWADGWTFEPTLTGTPRVIKEYGNSFATITPATDQRGGYHWAVYHRLGGEFLRGGWSGGPKNAANAAWKAIQSAR